MTKRWLSVLFGAIFLFSGQAWSQQLQTGTIRGTVTEESGTPLPGVAVTATGPRLIGQVTAVTNEAGAFRLPALPPGTYSLTFALSQFQPVKRDDVIVNVGMTVTINIQMKPSTLEEQITVVGASPVVDIQNTKIVTQIDSNMMMNLPVARSLTTLINMSPGTISGITHGGTGISASYEVDGVNVNDPSMNGRAVTVEYDAMEEVEIITGGLPAQVGNTGGSFVNVVTKSGGNTFSGMVQGYYNSDDLNEILFSDEQIRALGVGKPSFAIYNIQGSGILGGPIIKDKLWFFLDGGLTRTKSLATFRPTTILGKSYDQYTPLNTNYQGFGKMTAQLAKNLRAFVMVNYSRPFYPYSGGGTYVTQDATQYRLDNNWAFTANASWILSPNTFIDFRAGMSDTYWDIRLQKGTEDGYAHYDAYTYYSWGNSSRFDEPVWRNTTQGSIRLTHFQDNFLGGDHEIKAGVEVQTGVDEWTWWRNNPIGWYYYNGSPYYYRGLYGLSAPHPTYGDGYLYMYVCGPESSPNVVNGTEIRFGAFIQDSWTIKNRLTLNIGVRFDSYNGFLPESKKAASAGIASSVGETLFVPAFGFNPYGAMTIPRWDDVMGWSPFSPRFGATYDLFGDGRTAVKVALSRYSEAMPVMYFQTVHPLRPRSFGFYWTDLNGNGVPDAATVDKYVSSGGSPAMMLESYYRKLIQPNIKAPMYNEYVASITHELFRNFSLGLQYIYHEKKDTVDDVLYDSATGRYWNAYEEAPDWWIPFTTTVPAAGAFPAQTFTMYFMSDKAPYTTQMNAFANVKQAIRKYHGVELTFNKRYSDGWQLGGSIVYSRVRGNNTDDYGSVWGYSGAYNNPNWFVNRYGYIGADRPLVIKLYGSFRLPARFIASFYSTYYSGSPWQRTVTVFPPSGWMAAKGALGYSYSVNVEPSGTRRNPATTNVDFRLEKEFLIGRLGKLGVFVDVFNLLGSTFVNVSMNPAGTWRPTDEFVTTGTYTAASTLGQVTSISGVRTYRVSGRFSF
ncbi:MAG: TonB-dependent receptor [Candidatus Aminicenantes bacterium]|nr:TonB-dependent receptor [Candidatus Aminicenantes bacterium]